MNVIWIAAAIFAVVLIGLVVWVSGAEHPGPEKERATRNTDE